MVTNYIVEVKGTHDGYDWKERYVLPQFRTRMMELEAIMRERDYEPIIVIGRDGLWWNDELGFPLDRMSDGHCGFGDVLYAWANEIEEHPLHKGETREIVYDGMTFSVTADETPMTDGLISNDCKPIYEEVK